MEGGRRVCIRTLDFVLCAGLGIAVTDENGDKVWGDEQCLRHYGGEDERESGPFKMCEFRAKRVRQGKVSGAVFLTRSVATRQGLASGSSDVASLLVTLCLSNSFTCRRRSRCWMG